MDGAGEQPTKQQLHIVAMPFPGRGHINPMMNLCKILLSTKPHTLITFVITQEWLGFIGSDPKPHNIRFATLPNVIPPERLKAVDFPGFYDAVMTNLESPFEELLDQLEPPVDVFFADVELLWGVGVGNRKNIPVASVWTMSASVFSMFLHFDLIERNQHYPADLSEHGDEVVDYIPGTYTTQVADLPTEADPRVLKKAVECVSMVSKSQYLLFTSLYELEPQAFESLKLEFPFPVYPVGPAIPYLDVKNNSVVTCHDASEYLTWLDSQPQSSVLYISLGSFLSVSREQMDEIVAGLHESGVRYLWVARGEAPRLKQSSSSCGLVVAWCDQLKVLSHPSVGGFWSHCGWNSTLEAVFAGVPILTFPLFLDQAPNSKQIVEDWKIGWRMKKNSRVENEGLVIRQHIAQIVKEFMDIEASRDIREKVAEIGAVCGAAIADGGSSMMNLKALLQDITQKQNK